LVIWIEAIKAMIHNYERMVEITLLEFKAKKAIRDCMKRLSGNQMMSFYKSEI